MEQTSLQLDTVLNRAEVQKSGKLQVFWEILEKITLLQLCCFLGGFFVWDLGFGKIPFPCVI